MLQHNDQQMRHSHSQVEKYKEQLIHQQQSQAATHLQQGNIFHMNDAEHHHISG
jgi:threonyl-tRNA synthetase